MATPPLSHRSSALPVRASEPDEVTPAAAPRAEPKPPANARASLRASSSYAQGAGPARPPSEPTAVAAQTRPLAADTTTGGFFSRFFGGKSAEQQTQADVAALRAKPAFQALPPGLQGALTDGLQRQVKDPGARQTLAALAQTPGLAALPPGRAEALVRLASGTTDTSVHARGQLAAKLGGLQGQDAAGQAKALDDFLRSPQSYPANPEQAPQLDPAAAKPVVGAPTTVAGHPFRSGPADAQRYDVKVGDRTVPVFMPTAKPPDGMHLPSVEDVAQGLAALPPKLLSKVKTVQVEAKPNAQDAYWQKQYADPKLTSYMSAGAEGTVFIFPTAAKQTAGGLAGSLAHETGHIVSNQAWGGTHDSAGWKRWKQASESDAVYPTAYATKSPGEDFSETLQAALSVRGTPQEAELRALFPARYRLLGELGVL